MNLTEPTLDYVQQGTHEFDADEKLENDERAVGLIFQQWPANTDYVHVLVKTIVLNKLYSTNIIDVRTVAQHIVSLGIDERLHQGDASLIHDIASVQLKEKQRFLLSFATKYCSWHEPEHYQIFDSKVEMLLLRYQKQFNLPSFRKEDLREYPKFLGIVDQFRSRFGLMSIGRKELDKFLWIEGKRASNSA